MNHPHLLQLLDSALNGAVGGAACGVVFGVVSTLARDRAVARGKSLPVYAPYVQGYNPLLDAVLRVLDALPPQHGSRGTAAQVITTSVERIAELYFGPHRPRNVVLITREHRRLKLIVHRLCQDPATNDVCASLLATELAPLMELLDDFIHNINLR